MAGKRHIKLRSEHTERRMRC